MSARTTGLPIVEHEFEEWKNTATLCRSGHRDEALMLVVFHAPFSCPGDPGCRSIAEKGSEEVVLMLDRDLPWCRVPRLQAERFVRLLRSGKLSLHVSAFRPNSPDVLSGRRARILPPAPLTGLPPARQQPAEGFSTPHHLRASLCLGPNANLLEIRRLITRLGG